MAKDSKAATTRNEKNVKSRQGSLPKSIDIFEKGIKTSEDFANGFSALMSDIITGKVTPQMGNATCNAGGKLLKMVEMTYKYGGTGKGGSLPKKTLTIAFENSKGG